MDLGHPHSLVALSRYSKYGSSYTLSASKKAKGRLSDKFRREHFINKLLERYENPLRVSGFPGRICIVVRRLCKKHITGYLQLPMYITTDAFFFSSGTVSNSFCIHGRVTASAKASPEAKDSLELFMQSLILRKSLINSEKQQIQHQLKLVYNK